MSSKICPQCRHALRQSLQRPLSVSLRKWQQHATVAVSVAQSRKIHHELDVVSRKGNNSSTINIRTLLSSPTWSVRSLLPSSSQAPEDAPCPISAKTLHHLLRLSALPSPSSPEEEASMLETLASQLHFVRAIQSVDTTGVEALRAIRDETAAGMREQTIGLDALRGSLEKEDVVGRARRPRRRRELSEDEKEAARQVEKWDVLGGASIKAGRYFVVRSRKGEESTSVG